MDDHSNASNLLIATYYKLYDLSLLIRVGLKTQSG